MKSSNGTNVFELCEASQNWYFVFVFDLIVLKLYQIFDTQNMSGNSSRSAYVADGLSAHINQKGFSIFDLLISPD